MDAHLGAVVKLMAASPIHRNWFIADIERLVLPPIDLEQCAVIRGDQGLVAFASYARLSDEAAEGFVSGSRKLTANDWRSGGQLWMADVIAPYGHARAVCGHLRKMLWQRGFGGHVLRFRRNYNDGGPRRYSQVLV